MRILLLILLSVFFQITLYGQSSERPQSIVIPISSIGEVSETRKQILQNTLTQELSKHFQILPQDQFERVQEKVFQELEYDECTEDQCIVRIQEVLQIENVFNLQVIGEGGDTQLNLKWMNLDEKKNVTDFCENCKTKKLIKSTIVIVNKLLENKNRQDDVNKKVVKQTLHDDKSKDNVLFWKNLSGSWEWVKDGNRNIDMIYKGDISEGVPHGRGTFTMKYGEQSVGEFKNGKEWNTTRYYKNGSIIGRYVNGEWKMY